ncbi:MAG TPA: ribonuclease III [Deltaproteobacteria bacterium]|nr:ribonuclease III [Deltaproteobacteria bacterium]
MDKERINLLKKLEKTLQYRFEDKSLLSTALTHRSFINENASYSFSDNERLEFLGDAVLGLCVSDILVKKFSDLAEGQLSKLRSHLVNESFLAGLAIDFNIGDYLLLGHGEERSGGRGKISLLANCMEAVIGAIYMDSDFKKAHSFVKRIISPSLHSKSSLLQYMDYKTALQEYCQDKYKTKPVYTIVRTQGPEHAMTFEARVNIPGFAVHKGQGKSKKEAEKNAAQNAWIILHNETR